MTKSLDDFFEGKVKEDFEENKKILKVIVGESPYYKGKNKTLINEDVVLRVENYPTEIVAFFRKNWTFNRSMICILSLLFGGKEAIDFLNFVKDNRISAEDTVIYLKENFNYYFVNLYKRPTCKQKNIFRIRTLLENYDGHRHILFTGVNLKERFEKGSYKIPKKNKVTTWYHPTKSMDFEEAFKQWVLFEDIEVMNTFRIFKS